MTASLYDCFAPCFPAFRLLRDAPMSAYTTMRVGGRAELLVELSSEADAQTALRIVREQKLPFCYLGNGSNLLVADDGFHGVVLTLGNGMRGIVQEGATLTVQAGAPLSAIARFAADRSLGGLEFAAGIPGTLGGALCMNAGAYGGEMKDVVTSVRVCAQGEIRTLSNAEMEFSYRHSKIMAENWLALSATLTLCPHSQAEINALIADFSARRRAKQPLQYPSCGSFFKRPSGHFAGALIEEAGLKGYQIGGAQVSALHAGFLINTGNATAGDVYRLMRHVQETVYRHSGVQLEPEVRLLGDFSKS